MAYERDNLISRAGYSSDPGLGDVWDSITGAAGGVLDFWGKQQQAVGAAQQAAQTNKDLAAALAAQQGGGISTETIMIGAGVALVAFFLLRKKS